MRNSLDTFLCPGSVAMPGDALLALAPAAATAPRTSVAALPDQIHG
jgi:hypothetical protein